MQGIVEREGDSVLLLRDLFDLCPSEENYFVRSILYLIYMCVYRLRLVEGKDGRRVMIQGVMQIPEGTEIEERERERVIRFKFYIRVG